MDGAGFSPDKSVVYKTVGDVELKLHIFNPEGHQATDKRPAIVFFFGGGWMGGSPSQFYPHCEHLASQGMVAISAEYRVQGTHKTTPRECVRDGKSAVRWIRQHAGVLGVDPAKVLAGGGSAGGHVAAATGTTTAFEEAGEDLAISSVPAALVLFNPVFDNGPGGYGHDRVKEYWKDISPMYNISGTTPPTVVFLGSRDKHITVETAKEYKRLMEAKGGRCDLHIYEDQAHGFFNYANQEFYHKTVADMDQFLVSLGATLLTAYADENGRLPGQVKAGSDVVDSTSGTSPGLLDALAALQKHIRGESVLDDAAVTALTTVVGENKDALMSSQVAIRAAQDLVSGFDAKVGPLWVKHPPLNQKQKAPGDATRWAVFWVMQHLMDELYTTEGMRKHRDLLDGFRFGSADHFPGPVEATPDPTAVYRVKINGSYPDSWGGPVMHMERPARKPTGAYLVPGTIATVTVPEALVGKGYQILVGAHTWDHSNKPKVLRLYRVTARYDIDSTEVKVANPLGGGLYIEVPAGADAGIVEVAVRNAVRAPYFSWKPFHRSTLEEWQEVERHHKAPWADFQSEMYMMQVPTRWIYALDDPATLMKNWDKSLEVCNALMGRPTPFGREVLYNQVDLQMRGKAFHPGYPAGNRGYDPMDETDGYSRNHLVRGPQNAHNYEFHELGHAFLFPKYEGDQESAVNLPHVAVMHQAFGVDLNEAFRGSRFADDDTFKTLDTSAIEWMMSDSFVGDGVMKAFERAYQLKGHAKFVDIARLFGWDALGKFFASMQQNHMDGKPWPRNSAGEEGDAYTLRLSESVGADLRPLIHFWGIPIVNPETSDAAFRAAGLQPSAKVHDLLVHYKGLIPADNAAFRDYAFKWWGKEPRTDGYTTERNHAARWASYDEEQAATAGKTLQAIIDRYFPK